MKAFIKSLDVGLVEFEHGPHVVVARLAAGMWLVLNVIGAR